VILPSASEIASSKTLFARSTATVVECMNGLLLEG
jgi:hypothetical protein